MTITDSQKQLGHNGVLVGGNLLPGFTLAVREIFKPA